MHDRRDLRRRSASSGVHTTAGEDLDAPAAVGSSRADPARLADVSGAGRPRPRARSSPRSSASSSAAATRSRAAVVDRRGGRGRHAGSRSTCSATARRFARTSSTRTSSFPPGCSPRSPAARRSWSPRTGRTSRTRGASRAVRAATRVTVAARTPSWRSRPGCSTGSSRSSRRRAAKSTVIDCGVDLDRFSLRDAERGPRGASAGRPRAPGSSASARLSERKNVLRLARAFERRGEGGLAFVGDGPLRPALEGRAGIHLAGRVAHDRVASWIAPPT